MVKCPICENENGFKVVKAHCAIPSFCAGETLVRYDCPKCNVIFGPMDVINMTTPEICNMYRRHYDDKKQEREQRLENDIVGIDHTSPGDSVLNWGSGPASLAVSKLKKERGIDLYNFDPFGRPDYNIITDEKDLKDNYDLIISSDVIEHLQDPVGEFMKMKKRLKDKGKMLHVTECYRYTIEITKFHLFFFKGNSVDVLAEKTGFKVLEKSNNSCLFESI